MRPAKIALVIPGFQSSSDDWCIPVFTNLARQLSHHVDLHVFALRYPPRHDLYRVGAVHVHALGAGLLHGRRLPGVSLVYLWQRFLAEIAHEHALSRFSAVVGIWATESGWLATRAARHLRIPSLVHVAGGELIYIPTIKYGNRRRDLAGWLVQSTLRRADVLTVPSSTLSRELSKRVPPAKIRSWAPGVDTRLCAPLDSGPVPSTPFTFITAGSLIHVKGHDLLIRAMAQLRAQYPGSDIRLRIAGDGPLRPQLESLSAELGLTGYVAFSGEVRHDVLPDIYRSSDAFLVGSWHESQCMAALEAMSCGMPCVAPPVGALADLASSGKGPQAVHLFTQRSPEYVARAMKEVVDLSLEQRQGCGMRARELVLQHYEMGAQADKLLALLGELTAR